MSSTIETNLREMAANNGRVRKMVQRVSKESIATNGNGRNGAGRHDRRHDHEFAGAVEEEI